MKPGQPGAPVVAWFDHQYAARALRRVQEAADQEGLPLLPVKGVLLAHMLYSDVGERPMRDVDIRLRRSDLQAFERLCRGRGWPIARGSRQWGTFEIMVGPTLVEFETSVGPPGVCALTIEEMMARATLTSTHLGFPHLEPEVHDHALLMCVNVFKDKFKAGPVGLEDLVRLARQPSFDPIRLVALANRTGTATVAWLAADWAARAVGSEPWREVRDRLGTAPPRPLYTRAFRALAASERGEARQLLRLVARAASDRPTQRVRALLLGAAGTIDFYAQRWRASPPA